MRFGFRTGVWSAGLFGVLSGAGLMATASASQNLAYYIGLAGVVCGIVLLVWGFQINGRHWWRRSRVTLPVSPAEASTVGDRKPQTIKIDECYFEGNGGAAILMQGDANLDLKRSTFKGNQQGGVVHRPVVSTGLERSPLGEAFSYYLTGQWGETLASALMQAKGDGELFGSLIKRFEQDAHDGRLSVWGRQYRGYMEPSPLETQIPFQHWVDYQLDPLRTGYADAKTVHRHWSKDDAATVGYDDLKVDRAQFEKAWPRD